MKQKFISWLSFLAVFTLMVHSCRNDYLPERSETYNNSSKFQLTSQRISLNQSKHKAGLLPELQKAEAEFKAQTKYNASGKTVQYGDGVSINTNDVIYVENGPNYHTYTFRINRENAPADAPVENLVLSPLSDGTYRELLVTYDLTSQEKQQIENGIAIDLTGKVSAQVLASGTYGGDILNKTTTQCHWETYIYTQPCVCHPGHTDINSCDCDKGKPVQYVLTWNVCEEVEDPAPTGGSTDTGSSGGGGTGTGTTTTCNEPGASTEPQDPNSTLGTQDGCNIGTPTLPNLGELPKTPCEKIKDWFANSKFKEKYDSITKPGIHSLDREKAYYMRYPPVGTNISPAYVEVNMSPCSTDGDLPSFTEGMGGLMHTHNDEDCNGNISIKVPSPTDIKTFLNTLMPESGQYAGGYNSAYSLVSTSGGNYMLMYSGTNYPGSINYYDAEKLTKEYKNVFTNLYTNETVSQTDIEREFTKFIKEKINKPGLEVYRVTPTSKVKLEYDPASPNSIKETPCP